MASGLVVLARAARSALLSAARASFPEEACGVLLGEPDGARVSVQAFCRAGNHAAADRDLQFALSPYDMHRASQQARASGWDIVGFFHSHPHGVARPSRQDWLDSNPWPGYVHLIAALDEHSHTGLTAWRYQPKGWWQDSIEDA